MDILEAIGSTSFVRLLKVVPAHCGEIYVKLEWENPTGSLKDRMAQAVTARADEDARLKPGDTVVEYTGGGRGPRWPWCAPPGVIVSISSAPMRSAGRNWTTWLRSARS